MADGRVLIDVGMNASEAEKVLNSLRRKIFQTEKELNRNVAERDSLGAQYDESYSRLEEALEEYRSLTEKFNNTSGEEQLQVKGQLDESVIKLKEITEETQRLREAYEKANEKVSQGSKNLAAMKEDAGALEKALAKVEPAARLSEALETSKQKLLKFAKAAIGITTAVALFKKLKQSIADSVKEFANYDEETRNNISGLKASLSTLKASWGAAFAPVFNAVVPILQKLISWLTTAANAVAMFFAALTGKGTYKKAIAGNNALAESYGGAGDAAEEAEGQIMGFDEINKLNDNSDKGGGGGSGAGGVAQEFEEMEIDPKVLTMLDKIKTYAQEIGILAGVVAAAFLAWKLSPLLGLAFETIFGVLTAIIGAVVFIKNGFDAWVNGVDWNNFIGMLEGAALVVVGLGIAFGTTGAAIGLLIAGVAMLVIGIRDWIETGKLSNQTFAMMETAILAIGVAIALLTGLWIPLVIAAIAGIVLAVVKNGDEIKKDCSDVAERIKKGFTDFVNKIKQAFSEFGTAAKKSFSDTWDNITRATDNFKNSFVEKFNAIRDKAAEVVRKVKEFFNFKWELPHIKLPHIQVDWTDTSNSSIARLLGITAIPRFSVNWYAKGGIVDGATLFGAGEAGREAVVPLERHTEWIKMVADGIVDKLTAGNQLADYITGRALPALASGQIVPPRALSGGSVFTDADIDRLVSGLSAAFSASTGGDGQVTKLYLDGRQIAEAVTKHQKQMDWGRGI